MNSNSKECPKCGSKMTYVRGANTFDGPIPEKYICSECDYEEEIY